MKKSGENAGGAVSVVASSVPAYYVLPGFLGNFRSQNDNTRFKILEGDSGNVLQKLLDFDAEIGIGSLNSGSEKIHSEVLFEDEIILITPNLQKYRNMNGKFPLDQLKKERFMAF